MLEIGLIVGSTRPERFADTVVSWVIAGAARRTDLRLTLLDLRDQNLPLFEEPVPPSQTGGVYSNPAAEAWGLKIGHSDCYVATVAEYNHGPTAALKNAFDSAFFEWRRKPIAFVGYGGVGAARAIEHLRGIAIELHMAPIRSEVNIAMEPFLAIRRNGKILDNFDYLVASRDAMLDDLVWWGNALKEARAR